jgi:Protein of unknown function (DUF726)
MSLCCLLELVAAVYAVTLFCRGDRLDRLAGEVLCLMWESKELKDINRAFMRMLARSAGQQAVQLALYATVSSASSLAAIQPGVPCRASTSWMAAAVWLCCGRLCTPRLTFLDSLAALATATMWPVAVLNGAHFIDSAWDVACARAEAGGKLLANMLMHGLHSSRPVTLVGTSIGARLVFHCCLELYKQGAGTCLARLTLLCHAATLEFAPYRSCSQVCCAFVVCPWMRPALGDTLMAGGH